jgi:hypothetical protein
MGKDAALKVIDKFRKSLIAGGLRPTRLILFGSYVTGRAHEDSDIDLILISPDFAGQDLWDRIQRIVPALMGMQTSTDVIPMTPEEWDEGGMIQGIAADGEDV